VHYIIYAINNKNGKPHGKPFFIALKRKERERHHRATTQAENERTTTNQPHTDGDHFARCKTKKVYKGVK
jgi:hypothetical protein